MAQNDFTKAHQQYIHSLKMTRLKIHFWQIFIIVAIFALWEISARLGWIDTFLFSCPSDIWALFISYLKKGEIFTHIAASVWETILGFTIASILGIIIAVLLWWFDTFAKIMDPLLVILNALPKTALAPILIVWIGASTAGIVAVAVFISLIVTIISAYSYFTPVEAEKIKLLQSFGASKMQILTKLILPANVLNIMSIVKINLGLSWVGVIVGEFLVSRRGIGYLIVYGSQVFRLDLVMMGVIVLAVCAWLMYELFTLFDKMLRRTKKNGQQSRKN